MTDTMIQGFICPFCMDDFGEFERLRDHVENDHPEEEDVDLTDMVVQNVKGFFDKAKRGIKKLDAKRSIAEISNNVNIANVRSELVDAADKLADKKPRAPRPLPPDIIPMGTTRSLTAEFRKFRDESINETAIRTNMLIIRLDRLIHAAPKDAVKRKEFEREIVPWLDDADVLYCPLCAARFGLTRRKHHCRLCGRVLCHACSRFLSYLSARKLTNPAMAHKMIEAASAAAGSNLESLTNSNADSTGAGGRRSLITITQTSMDRMKNLIGGAMSKVQNGGGGVASDETSLSSLLQQDASECMRVCGSCLADLERRENMMEHGKPPALVEQYDFLRTSIGELKNLVPTYVRLATSIRNGETMYSLKSVEEMRNKCLERQIHIDALSKRIAEDVDAETSGMSEMQLRRNIRVTTLHALQGLIGQIETLPTQEEYEELVRKHKADVARQVALARERTLQASQRLLTQSTSMPVMSTNLPTEEAAAAPPPPDDGWVPQQSKAYNPFLEEADHRNPLVEQRDLIKEYLEQAATLGKLDEVEMLERNLKEIEQEMRSVGIEF